MLNHKGLVLVVMLCFGYLWSANASEYSQSTLLTYYDYDATQPLDPVVTVVDTLDYFIHSRVTFQSVHDETVPAALYLPREILFGPPPYPVIFYLHGYGGSKELDPQYAYSMGYLLEALDQPYIFIGLDAQYHGEREVPGRDMYSLNFLQDRNGLAQTVLDHRRAIDYLETRADVDTSQIHLMGGSMGGILGAMVIGVEPRIKAASLIVGGADWTLLIAASELPPAYPMREALNHHYEIIPRFMDPVDPLYFIGNAGGRCAVQMHNGLYDTIVPTGQILFDAAREPKEIHWYPCGHDVGLYVTSITEETLHWFERY